MNKDEVMKWLGRTSAVMMLAVLGWLGAQIYWTLNAPESTRPSAQMETDAQRAQQAIVARHLFGVHVAVASNVASAPSDIKLNGAIAADKPGHRAYALLSIEGKPSQLVKEGDELAPGITLKRVHARQVELLRNGQPLTLSLPESIKAADPNKANPAALIATSPPQVGAPVIAPAAAPVPAPAAAPITQPTPLPAPPSRSRTRRSSSDDT